jgi:hypothetical protein
MIIDEHFIDFQIVRLLGKNGKSGEKQKAESRKQKA